MSSDAVPSLGLPVLRQYAASLVGKGQRSSAAPVLLLRSAPRWDGPDAIEVGDSRVQIRPGVSALAIRDVMRERPEDAYLIVLTDRSEADLGLGILSRCFDQRVVEPSLWQAVQQSFAATSIDGLLARSSWAAEPLVRHCPASGWPVTPTGMVTRDHALTHLAARILGLSPGELDPSALLEWSLRPGARLAFVRESPAVQNGLIDWAGSTVSPVSALILRSAVQGYDVDAVTIGLVTDVLWADDAPEMPRIEPRVRLETFTGTQGLDRTTARALADAARGVIQRRLDARDARDAGVAPVLVEAAKLFEDIGFADGASESTVLPEGYVARLQALARAIQGFLADPARLPDVEVAFASLIGHSDHARRPETAQARMAVRLARWLATPDDQPPTTLATAVLRQARVDSFVDWAAADVWHGTTQPEMVAAWERLYAAVRQRRDRHDRQFAALLADATARDLVPEGPVPVESALTQVVLPLASRDHGVLLVVVDGMSTSVAAELADEAPRFGWYEAVPAESQRRTALVAALPTLTRYSRTSLFVGELSDGGQSQERAGFAARTGGRVFHKADLIGGAGEALPQAVRDAVRSSDAVCAVVLNTVDDALAKADPGGVDWTIESIQHLRALLAEAEAAGRAVVLTSDHGHVVERGSEHRPVAGAEARWRAVDSGPVESEREVLLRGSRVLAPGGAVVVAVDERLRYATRQAGYHGGASAAEVVIPVIVLARDPEALRRNGWVPAAPQAPEWWLDTVTVPAPVVEASPRQASRTAAPSPDQGTLDLEMPAVAATPAGAGVVDAVLASPMYRSQVRKVKARAVADDVVRAMLNALVERGGRASSDVVAAAARVPTYRMRSTVVAVQRQLNLEGYEALSIDADGVTLVLDEVLLREQFLSDGPA